MMGAIFIQSRAELSSFYFFFHKIFLNVAGDVSLSDYLNFSFWVDLIEALWVMWHSFVFVEQKKKLPLIPMECYVVVIVFFC